MALQGMDTYSNILYVKEHFAALSHLAHRVSAADKYRPETCCIIGNYYSLKGQHEKVGRASAPHMRSSAVIQASTGSSLPFSAQQLCLCRGDHSTHSLFRTEATCMPRSDEGLARRCVGPCPPQIKNLSPLHDRHVLLFGCWQRNWSCPAGCDLLQAGAEAEQALPLSLDAHGS